MSEMETKAPGGNVVAVGSGRMLSQQVVEDVVATETRKRGQRVWREDVKERDPCLGLAVVVQAVNHWRERLGRGSEMRQKQKTHWERFT